MTEPRKPSPWTSVVVVFVSDCHLGDMRTTAGRIGNMRGVMKCMPVSKSDNPVLARTYYCQLDPNIDPFSVIHRITTYDIVDSVNIHKTSNSSRIKKA